jgi:hypothetical protein
MRKSKPIHWHLKRELEEAGEEDLCSLLNTLMGRQSFFGSGDDLAEVLEALAALEARGELRVREYRIEGGSTVFGEVLEGSDTRLPAAFEFDSAAGIWRWKDTTRQMVELPDD